MKNYIYLNILAEGQAEREFAQNTLGVYFEPFGIVVDSRCVLTSRNKKTTAKKGTQPHPDRIKAMMLDELGHRMVLADKNTAKV